MLWTPVVISLFCSAVVQSSPVVSIVETKSGKFRGLQTGVEGVVKFLGIRYAKPPIGPLRFRPTEMPAPVSGVVNATVSGSVCPQIEFHLGEKLSFFASNETQSEDCLFLDIYKPQTASPDNPKAVMVWIHGGGYTLGTGNTFDGSLLAGLNDVVVVTMNYRIGILGFLSTLDEHAVGNLGLRDQLLALRWIQQNIEGFGGDRSRVTLFGESAGGSSVSQLAVSERSRGLFQRVIAQSGSVMAQWAFANNPLQYARDLGVNVGCNFTETGDLVSCLREIPVESLVDQQRNRSSRSGIMWAPVLDGDIFTFSSDDLRRNLQNHSISDQFSQIDFMIGVCSDEGSIFFEIVSQQFREMLGEEVTGEFGGINERVYKMLLSQIVTYVLPASFKRMDLLEPSVYYRYTDWKNPQSDLHRTKQVIQLWSDALVYVSGIQLAKVHAGLTQAYNLTESNSPGGRTFFYHFNQPPSWIQQKPWSSGADHGDDLFFVFAVSLQEGVNSTEEERTFTRQIMRYWTNFAKTGNPNEPSTDKESPEWPRYETDSELYLDLDTMLSDNSVKNRFLPERIAFWTHLFPQQVELFSQSCEKGDED